MPLRTFANCPTEKIMLLYRCDLSPNFIRLLPSEPIFVVTNTMETKQVKSLIANEHMHAPFIVASTHDEMIIVIVKTRVDNFINIQKRV